MKTDTGALTWNTNGTLKQLAITDQWNSADTQTCAFGYDDLSRVSSANCGTAWNQSFSFDPFGNVAKSGIVSFNPGYSTSTNRYTSLPGLAYDNNGNPTNDSFHSYTWDAEGRSLSIDTVGLIYDALGRMAEQNRIGAYTEIVYTPGGAKLALMTGQTLQKAFVSLPGGPTAVYNSSGLAYYRHADWLGSSRFASTPSRGLYYDVAYAAYGENYAATGTADLSFTGQNQDTIAGTDDFLFREYNPNQGRWISPDPAGIVAADPTNPQSWNRYAYVTNPLEFVDLLGLVCSWNVYPVAFSSSPEVGFDDWGGSYVIEWNCSDPHHPDKPEKPDKPDSKPSQAANTATIRAYQPSVYTCLAQAGFAAVEDLLGISMLPGTDQDNWEWSSDKLGFVYTGASEEELLGTVSNGVGVMEKAADYVEANPAAQGEIRQFLRSEGMKVSLKHVSKDAATLGKWAGRAGKVLAAVTAAERYKKCMD